MPIETTQFWTLLEESRLISPTELADLRAAWDIEAAGVTNSDDGVAVARWLMSRGLLRKYQALILLSGRAGPLVFGDYRTLERINRGRLAGGYRAIHAPSGHRVLLVFLHGSATASDDAWSRTVGQVVPLTQLRGPHVQRVYEVVDVGRYKFVVVEDLAGESLDRVAAGTTMPADDACQIVYQAALGLEAHHSAGQVHGAVGASNVWLERSGNVKLLSRPLAAEIDDFADRSPDGRSPEKRSDPETNPASVVMQNDVRALGRVLYDLITGQTVSAEKIAAAAKSGGRFESPIVPLTAADVADARVVDVVNRLLSTDSSEQFADAGEAAQALRPLVDVGRIRRTRSPAPTTLMAYEALLIRKGQSASSSKPDIQATPTDAEAGQIDFPALDVSLLVARGKNGSGYSAEPAGRARWQPIALLTGAVVLAAFCVFFLSWMSRNPTTKTAERTDEAGLPATVSREGIVDSTNVAATGGAAGVTEERASALSRPRTASDRQIPPDNERQEVVPDDGELLWASPTAGQPVSLAYLPPGVQMVLSVRVGELAELDQWPELLVSVGPLGEWLTEWLKASTFGSGEIEQLTVGLWTDNEQRLGSVAVLRLRRELDEDGATQRWPSWTTATHGAGQYHQQGDRAIYLPPEAKGRVVVFGSVKSIEELIDVAGAAPPVQREMATLLADSDESRHVNLLLTPVFLLGDGRSLLAGPASRLHDPLDWFFGDNVRAALVSLQFGDDLFAELRTIGTLDDPPQELATEVRGRLAEVPDRLQEHLARLQPHEYSRVLLERFPPMVRLLDQFARSGVENRQAVVRCYLPGPAGHNLLLGSQLALLESAAAASGSTGSTGSVDAGGAAGSDGTAATGTGGSGPASLEEKLRRPITVRFDRDTLEAAVARVAEELDVPIEIAGSDLQMEGITKNQSLALDMADRPAGEVLVEILRLANPDKSARSTADAAQKLVYVARRDEATGKKKIVVTTRSQAEKRGESLPEAFVGGK